VIMVTARTDEADRSRASKRGSTTT
jgi:hypothetical protein